jgi:C-terminal processing protease CtpA/Prc
MLTKPCCALIGLLSLWPLPAVAQQAPWVLSGAGAAQYTLLTATGSALDRTGATLTLRSDTAKPSAFGTILARTPADSFRGRRVRIIADIDAHNVTGWSSSWLRVDGPSGTLEFDNGQDDPLKGTSSGHREMTLFVPQSATLLYFGLLMSGSGEATARGLRIEARPPVAANAPLVPAAQRVLDSAITIVRARALWRDTVTWAEVEPRVRAIAAGAENTREGYPAITMLLSSLGDHHSFFQPPTATRQFQTGGAQNPRPTVNALPDSIGYISVPGYAGVDTAAARGYVTDVRAALAAVQEQSSCRWVVDLRANTGGNMWPMLGGLEPFLGNAGLGSFVTNAGAGPLWHANDVVKLPVTPALSRLDSAYVAVLTSPRTGSSGEAVTIAFIGRPHTRSFGLPTAGLSTANRTFVLPDTSMIVLTVSVEADRNGKRYGQKIEPDEVVAADPVADPQLARAVAWLRSQPSCIR